MEVSAIEVHTPSEVVAVNGSDVKLSCTFKSTQPVSDQSVTVVWNYRPPNSQAEISVNKFLYFSAVTIFDHRGVEPAGGAVSQLTAQTQLFSAEEGTKCWFQNCDLSSQCSGTNTVLFLH